MSDESGKIDEPGVGEQPRPLPCPFCGATNVEVVEGSTYRWRLARCVECDAQAGEIRCPPLGEGTRDEWEVQATRDAILAWNERAVVVGRQVVPPDAGEHGEAEEDA